MTQKTEPNPDLLPALAGIIAGWERAEGIRVLHAWVTDAGTWQVQWIGQTNKGTEPLGGGENSMTVSRLIVDLKEALKAHGIDARHIARPGPDALRVWTADGQYLRWPAPATEPTRHIRREQSKVTILVEKR